MTYLKQLEVKESEILNSLPDGKPQYPIICIAGLSGSGKGTASKIVQKELKKLGLELKREEGGKFFRAVAKDMGYGSDKLEEFNELRSNDRKLAIKVDREIEKKTLEHGLRDGGIFDGRLCFATFGENSTISIFLITPLKLLAERINADPNRSEYGEGVDTIMKRIKKRNDADIKTYNDLYGIDYEELVNKCIILENCGTKEELKEDLMDIIVPKLKDGGFIE